MIPVLDELDGFVRLTSLVGGALVVAVVALVVLVDLLWVKVRRLERMQDETPEAKEWRR